VSVCMCVCKCACLRACVRLRKTVLFYILPFVSEYELSSQAITDNNNLYIFEERDETENVFTMYIKIIVLLHGRQQNI